MKLKESISCIIAFLVLFSGCGAGDGGDSHAEVSVQGPDVRRDSSLQVTDTLSADLTMNLGIMTVDDLDGSSAGVIAILDGAMAEVTLISDSGDSLARFGGAGSGPGEFQRPVAISLSESGGVAVSDMMAGTVRILEPGLDSYTDVQGFLMANPGTLNLMDNGDFAGMRMAFQSENDNTVIGHQTALWTDGSSDPSIVYHENMEPFSPNDFGRSLVSPYPMTCDQEGNTYLAQVSFEEYVLLAYGADGSGLWSVERPFEPIEKTDMEIKTEADMVERRMQQSAHQMSYTPDPYHYAVSSLAVGPGGRLWAGRPGNDPAVFDVFDRGTGEFLFSAAVDEGLDLERIEVTRGGIFGITAGEHPSLLVLSL